jgi:outer membrane protein assembly factor BamE (lipoprotein component of BamABCDE complex)
MKTRCTLTVAALVALSFAAACSERLVRDYSCEQLRQVHVGNSPEQVLSLLGEPTARQGAYFDDSVRKGKSWYYQVTNDAVFVTYRDSLRVDFVDSKVKAISAYRRVAPAVLGRQGNASLLQVSAGQNSVGEMRREGELFTVVFPCRNAS